MVRIPPTDSHPSEPQHSFNGVKVFSATMVAQREALGEVVERWIGQHADCDVRDIVVRQSSDDQFHCVSITLFYFQPTERAAR